MKVLLDLGGCLPLFIGEAEHTFLRAEKCINIDFKETHKHGFKYPSINTQKFPNSQQLGVQVLHDSGFIRLMEGSLGRLPGGGSLSFFLSIFLSFFFL